MEKENDRSKLTKNISDALGRLAKKGVRAEDIAAKLHVSYSSVKGWVSGRRFPKVSTIKQLELLFGVKIL